MPKIQWFSTGSFIKLIILLCWRYIKYDYRYFYLSSYRLVDLNVPTDQDNVPAKIGGFFSLRKIWVCPSAVVVFFALVVTTYLSRRLPGWNRKKIQLSFLSFLFFFFFFFFFQTTMCDFMFMYQIVFCKRNLRNKSSLTWRKVRFINILLCPVWNWNGDRRCFCP